MHAFCGFSGSPSVMVCVDSKEDWFVANVGQTGGLVEEVETFDEIRIVSDS